MLFTTQIWFKTYIIWYTMYTKYSCFQKSKKSKKSIKNHKNTKKCKVMYRDIWGGRLSRKGYTYPLFPPYRVMFGLQFAPLRSKIEWKLTSQKIFKVDTVKTQKHIKSGSPPIEVLDIAALATYIKKALYMYKIFR